MFPSFLDQFTTHNNTPTIQSLTSNVCANVDNAAGRIDNSTIITSADTPPMKSINIKFKKGPLYIYEKRWYFRLVSKKDGEFNRARALMDDYELNMIAQHLVVCYTPGVIPGQHKPYLNEKGEYGRIYAFFESYLEFYQYMQKIPLEQRAFYEIVFGELPQKPHFDIDVGADNLAKYYPNENIDSVAELLREAVMLGCLQVLTDLHVDTNICRDLLLYSSHGSNKRSWHILINNKCHDGNKEARAFYEAVLVKVRVLTNGKYMQSEFIDPGVYSPRQQFRLIGSQKPGTNRPKIFCEQFVLSGMRYSHIYNEDVSELQIKKLTVIYESLIGFTTGCSYLPSLLPERSGNTTNLGDLPNLETCVIDQCMEMLKRKMTHCPFTVKNIQGHLIMLKRNAKSHCPICNRDHQAENPYMFIIGGKVYWDCRRSEGDATKLLLGYLAMSVDELMVSGYNGEAIEGIDNTIEDTVEEQQNLLMFGDYKLEEPTQSVQSPVTTAQAVEIKEPTPQLTPQEQMRAAMDNVNIPTTQRMQNIEAMTKQIVKTAATKKYMKSQPEDLLGVRSLSSVAAEMSWSPGLK